ncbi:MAG: hypothetical protein IPK64_00925 [bacterium]|nr:hypothetical protein [bacterium]
MRRLSLAAGGVLALAGSALADPLTLTPIGTYANGIYDGGGTEIAAYDPLTMRVFLVNGTTGNVEASPKQDPGRIVFFETTGTCKHLNDVAAGALPDMIAFSPDGLRALTANEGEPNDADTNDPEGSVTIVDLGSGVRLFGPGATVTDIIPLGTKDHSLPGNGLDPSNQDGGIHIANWPQQAFYLPDAIASYTVGNVVFDSGDQFEQIVAALQPAYFNGTNTSDTGFDSRSDDKGPEPEGVALAEIDGRWYALIGVERQGDVMPFDSLTVGIEDPIEEPRTEPANLPPRTQARLDIVDVRGHLVETLLDGMYEPGEYRLAWSAADAPAGVYLTVLRTDALTLVRRLTQVT